MYGYKKFLTFPLDFTWKHLHVITDAFFSCSFLKNIYNHTTKEVNFHVFQIRYWYWKRWKILNPSSNFVFLLKRYFLFVKRSKKTKIRGCTLAMWAAHGHIFFLFTFRGFAAFYHHHHQFVVLFVGAEVETVRSGFTLRHRGRSSSEGRDQSLLSLSLTVFLSLSLFSLV